VEVVHFAIRYDEQIKRWYQKKASKTLTVVALKAVAHKLARACYYMMREGESFDVKRAFS
jgi:transposase